MSLLNPYGWALLLGLPILYLLSRNNRTLKEVSVSSLKLWTSLLESNQAKKTLKHAASYLLLIHCLMIFIATIGLLDLYRVWTKEDQIVLLYDRSFSTQRISSKENLYNFLKGHRDKHYQVVFIDTSLEENDTLLNSSETLDLINRMPHSNKPLDASLLMSTYEGYKNQNKATLVISDKEELETLGLSANELLLLPADTKNMGLRKASYNPRENTFTIAVENDSDINLGQTILIEDRESIFYEQAIILSPKEYKLLKINLTDIHQDGPSSDTILTIRLADKDKIIEDNSLYCPYVKNLKVSLDDQQESLKRVLDLLPYVEASSSGVNINTFNYPPTSDVTYETSFIDAIQIKGINDLSVTQSPCYPLWIEDHLYESYRKNEESLLQKLPKDNPPISYIINETQVSGKDKSINKVDIETSTVAVPLKQSIASVYLFISFMVLMLIEEEVRRYV